MTLYDLTKKYSSGRGEEMMWKTLSLVSEAVETSMQPCDRQALIRRVYGAMSNGHYNEEFAREDMSKMYYLDDNGDKHFGPYWSDDALRSLYMQYKDEIPEYNCWDWMVTMTMMKADYCPLIMEWFPNIGENERNEKLVQLSLNWLEDEDNPYGTSKTWGYLNSK